MSISDGDYGKDFELNDMEEEREFNSSATAEGLDTRDALLQNLTTPIISSSL